MGRDIVIIPNRGLSGGTTHPEIRFSGLTDSSIKLKVEDDGSIVFDGNTGGLFEITDSKDGLLSAVSDVSGLPILAVYSDNRVVAGKWDDPGLTVINNQVFVGPTATTNASLYVSGNEEISGGMTIGESLSTTQLNTPTLTAGIYHDYDPGTDTSFISVRTSFTATTQFTGLINGVSGKRVVFHAKDTSTITFKHNSTGSSAANRFFNGNAATDKVLSLNDTIEYIYDSSINKWVYLGGSI